MYWRRLGMACQLAIGCWLIASTTGCLYLPARHGIILHGDWSLEMNRIPWMKGRTTYQDPAGSVVGTVPGTMEIDDPFGATSPEVCTTGPPAEAVCQTRPPLGSRLRLPCIIPTCRQARCDHVRPVAGPTPYDNHPRFHPVPSGPVFFSQGAPGTPSPAPSIPVDSVAPAQPDSVPLDPIPQPLEPVPAAPVPEVIPTPSNASEGEWKEQGSEQAAQPAEQTSWVFSLPAGSAETSGSIRGYARRDDGRVVR